MKPNTGMPGHRDLAVRLALFAALWWILVDGLMYGLLVALLVLILTLVVSFVVIPAVHWRLPLIGIIRFIPYFLAASLRGGTDVARRAFHPGLPLRPGFVEHRLLLTPGPALLFFVGTVSLLPGTLSVQLSDRLRLHVLDLDSHEPERLMELEQRVAALFGRPL
jgi:multicomponent Na+:H+ antiporter subunit E